MDTMTIAQLLSIYKGGDQIVRSSTERQCAQCLSLVLQQGMGIPASQVDSQRVSVLTGELVRNFFAARQGRSQVDYVTPLPVNTGANSTLRQARAVFSRRMQDRYRQVGLFLPESLDEFLRAPKLREPSHRYSDRPIPQEQIDSMNAALPDLRDRDERLWAIHLMIRLMGMRASEILRARRDWIVTRGSKTVLVISARAGEAAPKRSDGEIPIPQALIDWFAQQEGDWLIPAANKTERYNLIYRTHSEFVRSHVTGRTKSNHELRKWAGSVVATKTQSWERAAQFLRIDLETAKAHYLAFVDEAPSLDLDDLG